MWNEESVHDMTASGLMRWTVTRGVRETSGTRRGPTWAPLPAPAMRPLSTAKQKQLSVCSQVRKLGFGWLLPRNRCWSLPRSTRRVTKVLFFFSVLDSAASGGSLNKGLCYKLLIGHTPHPKNYLWDLATQFKAIENKWHHKFRHWCPFCWSTLDDL